jgi:hypothetical protein
MVGMSAIGRLPGSFDAGWDSFAPKTGSVKDMYCRVCDEKMKVKRKKFGPTSFVDAMQTKGHSHDHFFCGNSGTDWHNQLLDLRHSIEESVSRFAIDQMGLEIGYILKDRKPTLSKYTEAQERAIKWKKENPYRFKSTKKKRKKVK